jgi:hypothetical protein
MPIQSEILKVILDYLYTDEAVVIKGNERRLSSFGYI